MIDKTFIVFLVRDILGVPVAWANQNMHKPKKPYATVRLFGFNSVAMAEIRKTIVPGELDVIRIEECTLEIQYFGKSAIDNLLNLKNSLSKPTIVDKCKNNNIAFFDSNGVQDLTGLLDVQFEERAELDLSVRFTTTVKDKPGWIGTVQVNNKVEIKGE